MPKPGAGILPSQTIRRLSQSAGLIKKHRFGHCLSPASYELRVGSYFDAGKRRRLAAGDSLEIPPHSMVLMGTIEAVRLPLDIIGMMYLRSTYARLGLMPWFQGLVDPGYSGALTVVLQNATCQAVTMSYGQRVCHIVFERLMEAADRGYSGSYMRSLGAQPSAITISPMPTKVGIRPVLRRHGKPR
jgi:dCTP deaminase